MNGDLENLRKQIDNVDEKIISNLSKRAEIVRKIGKIKKKQNLSEFDQKRWQFILEKNIIKGEKIGLSRSFVKKVYQLIHQNSVKLQKEV